MHASGEELFISYPHDNEWEQLVRFGVVLEPTTMGALVPAIPMPDLAQKLRRKRPPALPMIICMQGCLTPHARCLCMRNPEELLTPGASALVRQAHEALSSKQRR